MVLFMKCYFTGYFVSILCFSYDYTVSPGVLQYAKDFFFVCEILFYMILLLCRNILFQLWLYILNISLGCLCKRSVEKHDRL